MMRYNLYLSCCLLIASVASLTAQETGIRFEKSEWNEILAKARRENKLIFMDAYASWCGPCKKMDKDVFSDARVGEVYNSQFINVKMDMEKGEGPALAERYGVRAYPTFLFIDGEGVVMHRAVGYQPSNQFIELAQVAADPSKQLGAMTRRYSQGNREPKFLYDYANALMDVMDTKAPMVVAEYLSTQEDWNTPEHMQLVLASVQSTEGPYFYHIVANKEAYTELIGQENFEETIYQTILMDMMKNEQVSPDAADKLFAKADAASQPRLSARFRMEYYSRQGQWNDYARSAIDYDAAYPIENAYQLNNIAWTFYERVEDKKLLKKGLAFAERSVAIEKQYANMDTLAALYFKLGKKKKARKAAEEAIGIARKTGEDPSDTIELLERINGKKA